jgi:hypothetical protein
MKKKVKYPQISYCQLEINALKKDIYRAERAVEFWKNQIRENPATYDKERLKFEGRQLYRLGLQMRELKTLRSVYVFLSNYDKRRSYKGNSLSQL